VWLRRIRRGVLKIWMCRFDVNMGGYCLHGMAFRACIDSRKLG
jgi:hypothetical protein